MKFVTVLVLCLALAVHETTAKPSIFDIISDGVRGVGALAEGAAGAAGSIADGVVDTANGFVKGVIDTATGISKGAIGAGTGVVSNLANVASSFNQAIDKTINEVKSKALQSVLKQVKANLQQIQDNSKELLHATEVAGQNVEKGVLELESKQEDSINAWADNAKNRLADSSEDAQIKGQDLIDGFANQRAEDLKKCTDKIVSELEELQEKANATAKRLDEPMSKLVEQVGKCTKLKANDLRGLTSCAADTRKALKPLLGGPSQLASVKAQVVKVGLQNVRKNVCVAATMTKFQIEAKRVDKEIDQLIADDKKANEDDNEDQEPSGDDDDQEKPADEDQKQSGDDDDQEKPADEDQKPSGDDDDQEKPADEDQKPSGDDDDQEKPADEDQKPSGDDDDQDKPADEDQKAPSDKDQKPSADDDDQEKPADEDQKAPSKKDQKPSGDKNQKAPSKKDKKPSGDKNQKAPSDKKKNSGEEKKKKPSGGNDKKNSCSA